MAGLTAKKLPRLTDCSLLTIQIVGTLPPIMEGGEANYQEQMGAFLRDVQAALLVRFPAFIPGHPPCTINVVDLAEPSDG